MTGSEMYAKPGARVPAIPPVIVKPDPEDDKKKKPAGGGTGK